MKKARQKREKKCAKIPTWYEHFSQKQVDHYLKYDALKGVFLEYHISKPIDKGI